jgi:heat shock protein HtpX
VGWVFGALIGNPAVAVTAAVVVAVAMSAGSYFYSARIALAMSHAQPASPDEYSRYHNLVEGLCIAAGLPKPALYVIEDDAPNAFATGRNPEHAAVAVTTGLLEKLNRIELEGVLAHELAHIRNHDILVTSIAVTMVGVVALLSDWAMRFMWWGGPRHRDDSSARRGGAGAIVGVFGIGLLVLAPLSAKLMQFAVSRRRESLADFTGVRMTRYPPGLIAALEKLKNDRTVVHSGSRATAHLWIESPLDREEGGKLARLNRLFDTHPPLEERIAALRDM